MSEEIIDETNDSEEFSEFTDRVFTFRLVNGTTMIGVISDNEDFEDAMVPVFNPMEIKECEDEYGESYHTFQTFLIGAENNILPFNQSDILVYSECNEKFTDIYMNGVFGGGSEETEPTTEEYEALKNRLSLGHIVTAQLGAKH